MITIAQANPNQQRQITGEKMMNIEFYRVSEEVPHNDVDTYAKMRGLTSSFYVDVLVRTSGTPEPVEYAVAYMNCLGHWQPVGASCDGEGSLYLDIEPYEWSHLPK